MSQERQTSFRWPLIAVGAIVAVFGTVLCFAGLGEVEAAQFAGGDSLLAIVGWGPLWAAVKGPLLSLQLLIRGMPHVAGPSGITLWGMAAAAAGLALVGAGIRHVPPPAATPSDAARAPLYPPLAGYRDFYWSTLFLYGGGILGSEVLMLVIQTLFAGGVRMESGEKASTFQMAPTSAFALALGLGCVLAFAAGFFGSARSRRLSAPEATIAVFYFGLPIPILLTAMAFSPGLSLSLGYRLREVVYLANLLGRPELGYWLVFTLLVLMMVLGITSGFVATGSGRVDLRTGFELFVARRHVSVFRPRFLLGLAAVLLLGIVPPLIIYAIVRAAEAAVERTRIKHLGKRDPLAATLADNEWKRREQSPTEMMTALSVGGVGVGVMALIVVLSVMSGFEADLQRKILGTNAHVLVLKYTDQFPEYRDTMEKIAKVRGVTGQTPFIMNEVMVSSGANISGTILEGIDPATVGTVTDLPKNILPGGKLDWLVHPEQIEAGGEAEQGLSTHLTHDNEPIGGEEPEDADEAAVLGPRAAASTQVLPGILIGRELAGSLKVVVGDRVNVVSPLGGELGPQGPMPKSRPFRVAGVFYTGMYEYDSKYVYVDLTVAQKFFGQQGPTGIALKVADIDDARRISKQVLDALDGYPYRTRDWGELNKNLFSALRLEKLVMGIILSIIVIVAAGLIVATVIMLVLEKRKEISVLKALGVSDGGIVKIFLAEGLQIGIAGGLLGLFAGLAWCVFIEKVGIKLDPEVYYIPALPVKIEPLQTALAVVIAILVTYLGSIYPALKASRVEPVEGLKAE